MDRILAAAALCIAVLCDALKGIAIITGYVLLATIGATAWVILRVGELAYSSLGKRLTAAPTKPDCFGSNPGPQERAENDCFSCRWEGDCLGRPL